MKFVFQGSQNLHIRVAISFEALIGFQCLICEIIVHFMPHWPVYSDFMGTFPTPSSSLCMGAQYIRCDFEGALNNSVLSIFLLNAFVIQCAGLATTNARTAG